MIADPDSEIDRRQIAAASLRTLMRLPVAQRSSVILMDVLGHSLEEIADVLDSTMPAVKAALHRGRERLRELAAEPDDRPPPVLAEADRARACRLCRALQCARLRRPPRPAGRRSEGRGREPHAAQRPQRGRPLLRQLRPVERLASGARPGRTAAGGAGARSRRSRRHAALLHAARLGGRPPAERPRFPLRPLRRSTAPS